MKTGAEPLQSAPGTAIDSPLRRPNSDGAMAAPHKDRQFSHGIHIIASVATLGVWAPVWLFRWTMHKIDRNREAIFELEQLLDEIAAAQK